MHRDAVIDMFPITDTDCGESESESVSDSKKSDKDISPAQSNHGNVSNSNKKKNAALIKDHSDLSEDVAHINRDAAQKKTPVVTKKKLSMDFINSFIQE